RASTSSCRHIVITAGNHDSPSLIAAPRELCKYLNITVIGSAPKKPEEMVLVFNDQDGMPELIVCPVPYLRDRDVRTTQAGESPEEKTANLLAGIKAQYHAIGRCAEMMREKIGPIPIIATGHLFAAGGMTREDDGSRNLYLGTLACVGADAFPPCIDYLALGHLHLPQRVCGSDRIRYSGAPLGMGFGEAGQTKSVLMLDVHDSRTMSIREIPVPVFHRLSRIAGTLDEVMHNLDCMKTESVPVLVEVLLQDSQKIPDAHERFQSFCEGTRVEVLRVRPYRLPGQVLHPSHPEESLAELSPEDVFMRRMDAAQITGDDRDELLASFREIYRLVLEEDMTAEYQR
ncbi:MAG TPA: exonuclease SbcCD subunit D C-terminal domain-containing protein, partial [Methanospirillum sp.]|nr:exonuclease SbcCD subunit D C-terminal domain-containing protein [Methanospirillum sp.]